MFANMNKILYSRTILYVVLAICLFQLFLFTSLGDYYSAAVFILVGYLTTFFSKNMLVILTIALVVSAIFKYGSQVRLGGKEGFDDEEGALLTDDTDNIIKSDSAAAVPVAAAAAAAAAVPAAPKKPAAAPKTTTAVPTTAVPTTTPISDAATQKLIDEKQAKLKKIADQYSILTEQMTDLGTQSNSINDVLTSIEKKVKDILTMIKEEQ